MQLIYIKKLFLMPSMKYYNGGLTSIVPPKPINSPKTTNMLAQNGPSFATLSGSFMN